ncbi:MAG: biotin/lipoyl-binding protein [Bacteroidales bacterium]|nr:biotin/lipoyl-binding protein [Bacteroidales bacterium]
MKEYRFKINGNEYSVAVNSISGNIADVTVNGTQYQVEMENAPATPVQAVPATQQPAAPAQQATVQAPQQAAQAAPKPSAGGKAVTSPLPGVIIAVKVNVGDTVKAGQVIAILEAMKMENEIQAEHDGTVASVNVSKGDSVLEGATIVTIA